MNIQSKYTNIFNVFNYKIEDGVVLLGRDNILSKVHKSEYRNTFNVFSYKIADDVVLY